MKKLVLLVAILAMVLGGGSVVLAQTTQDTSSPEASPKTTPSNDQTTTDQPNTNQPAADQPTTDQSTNDQTTTDQPTNDQSTNSQPSSAQPTTDQSALPCGPNLFRQEQEELVQFGYPTPVSERARECENLGWVNPYPAPALLGPDGWVYPYDPIEGQYMYFDPNTGLYYILDPVSNTVSTYDPATGTYL